MIFKEIEFNNFRIYKGHNTIYLAPEEGKNISVVSGLNGYGKTTFLMGLVWCLYGRQMDQVDDFYKKEIKENGGYDRYITTSLNRLAQKEGDTRFSVSIVIGDVNIPEIPCQEIRITRTFETVTGSSDQVEILIDGHQNELVKDLGDTNLTAEEIFIRDFILPMEIAKFFFFDAEKIISLAEVNNKEQRKQLNTAYSEVLGIKKYEDLKGELEGLRLRLRQDSASNKEKIELQRLKNELETFKIEIESDEEKIKELTKEKESKQYDADQIQETLVRRGNAITIEELNELRSKSATYSEKIKEVQEQLRNSYDIIPFAIAGEKLLEVVKQLEAESETLSAKFNQDQVQNTTDKIINDLIAEPKPNNLVIDYKVQDYYKSTIKKLIRKHFFSEVPDTSDDFQIIHDYSETEKNEFSALVNNLKLSFKESFKRINSEYNLYRNELSNINRRLKEAEANMEDPVVTDLREEKKKLTDRIDEIENEIQAFNRKVGGLENNVIQHNKRIQEISKKIAVSENNKAQDETANRLIEELQSFINTFKQTKKQSLEKEILEGLNSLMHKKNFIQKVEVDIVGDEIDIQLRDGRNGVIRKEALSNGEKQMYASALLKGLVEESNIEFPVFIDSPMQKFDVNHAENIVRYFYPSISDQVVIFPLVKKEMTEDEYEIILPKVANTYLIQNISDDQSGFVEVEPAQLFDKFQETRVDAV
jgi:DNA sulfur modification protein DndD